MRESDLKVLAVNYGLKSAFLSDGTYAPISNMFDEDGDEVLDSSLAVSLVIGPTSSDTWLVFVPSSESAPLH